MSSLDQIAAKSPHRPKIHRTHVLPPPNDLPPQLIAVGPVNSEIGFVPPPVSDPVIPPVAARTRAPQIGFVPSEGQVALRRIPEDRT